MERMAAPVSLDPQRAWRRLEHLAGLTDPERPYTRRAFTPLYARARAWLAREFAAAGLRVQTDAAGNLIGWRDGLQADWPPLVSGSHTDTVVGGGRYDGMLGVVAALEVAQALHEAGIVLRHPFEVIDFVSEEPSDYGVSCVGSRALSGGLSAQMLASCNEHGETLAGAMVRMGYSPEDVPKVQRAPESTAAYVELHIEQGPVLESRGLAIGVVSSIVGIARVRVLVEGRADHAGTTPMHLRSDALVGAARLIECIHARASALDGHPHSVVATVGRLALAPNVPNAVPARVEMVVEVRSDAVEVLDTFVDTVLRQSESGLLALRLRCQAQPLSRTEPTACAEPVMAAMERAARALGHASLRLPSGAGHDAVCMAATGPVGMLFVPCLDGRSHCPEESITPAQLASGLEVLCQTIVELDHVLAK